VSQITEHPENQTAEKADRPGLDDSVGPLPGTVEILTFVTFLKSFFVTMSTRWGGRPIDSCESESQILPG